MYETDNLSTLSVDKHGSIGYGKAYVQNIFLMVILQEIIFWEICFLNFIISKIIQRMVFEELLNLSSLKQYSSKIKFFTKFVSY